jgi:hypothetical protein
MVLTHFGANWRQYLAPIGADWRQYLAPVATKSQRQLAHITGLPLSVGPLHLYSSLLSFKFRTSQILKFQRVCFINTMMTLTLNRSPPPHTLSLPLLLQESKAQGVLLAEAALLFPHSVDTWLAPPKTPMIHAAPARRWPRRRGRNTVPCRSAHTPHNRIEKNAKQSRGESGEWMVWVRLTLDPRSRGHFSHASPQSQAFDPREALSPPIPL